MTKDALITIFPARKIGFRGKAGGEIESQAGVVCEGEFEGVIAEGGAEFHVFDNLALGLGKVFGL